ncbi:MAG: TIM barrel protein [Bacteroidota bacterium]
MKEHQNECSASVLSRRKFIGTTAGAAFAGALVKPAHVVKSLAPDIRGVMVGAISYSYRALPSSAEEVLGYLKSAGLDTVELMGNVAESFAGAPEGPGWPSGGRNASPEELQAFRKKRAEYGEVMKGWRMQADMGKFEMLGQMYHDAGVKIDILKLGDPRWSNDAIDYAFNAAKAVGARGISFEISDEGAERIAPFADKHQMLVGLHNHTQVAEAGFSFDKPLSYSKYNMLNLDIGHYIAGLSESPIPILNKYHGRISHLHLKDRKSAINGGKNVAWGDGDTPIGEVLRLLQRKQYPITAMIEFEYEVPEGSTVLAEMGKCVAYCKGALS